MKKIILSTLAIATILCTIIIADEYIFIADGSHVGE